MNIIHTADRHYHIKFLDDCKNTDAQLIEFAKDNKVDLQTFGGDLNQKVITQEGPQKSPHLLAIETYTELGNISPIIMIEGNPPHDVYGSLDVLSYLKTKYPIKVVKNCDDTFVLFDNEKKTFEDISFKNLNIKDLVSEIRFKDVAFIFPLPWPSKLRFLDSELLINTPIKELNKLYQDKFQEWLDKRRKLFKTLNKRFPFILLAHLQLEGSIASTGQELTSTFHKPSMFHDLCHYGALGHIHKRQRFRELYYSGSMHNTNLGEIEQKGFNYVEFIRKDTGIVTDVEFIKLNTPLLIKLTIEGEEEYSNIEEHINDSLNNKKAKYKVWISVEKIRNKRIVSEEKIKKLLYKFNQSELYKLTITEEKIVTKRSEDNSNKKRPDNIVDKFRDYCRLNNIVPNKYQIKKLQEAEEQI